jgi:hypothetical protein
MDKPLAQIVAENVRAARRHRKIDSYRELAGKAKVAPNSVKNLEEPEQRALGKRGSAAPRLDILDKVAGAMGFATWQLLVRDFDPANPPPLAPPSDREVKAWRKIEQAYRDLDKEKFDGNSRE